MDHSECACPGFKLGAYQIEAFVNLLTVEKAYRGSAIAQGENGRADKLISAGCYNYLDLRLSDRNRKKL